MTLSIRKGGGEKSEEGRSEVVRNDRGRSSHSDDDDIHYFTRFKHKKISKTNNKINKYNKKIHNHNNKVNHHDNQIYNYNKPKNNSGGRGFFCRCYQGKSWVEEEGSGALEEAMSRCYKGDTEIFEGGLKEV